MCAAPLDFAAERELIAITVDPQVVLDWVREYREHAREAAADGDSALGSRIDELIEFALDHVADLKAARLHRSPKARARGEDPHAQATPPRIRASVADGAPPPAPAPRNAASATGPDVPPNRAGAQDARRREGGRSCAEELAKERSAAEEAEAARVRAHEADLLHLQQRAAQARARRDAALAATAWIEAEARRAAEEEARVRRARARQQALRDAEEAERAAAQAEAAVPRVAPEAMKPTGTRARAGSTRGADVSAGPAAAGSIGAHEPAQAPGAADDALTPLALLFREQLGELGGMPTEDSAAHHGEAAVTPRQRAGLPTAPAGAPPRPPPAGARPGARHAGGATPSPVPPASAAPPPAPVDEVPPLTGADLASYRSWLGVSQRALATKLGVEQSSVSRGEGRPTTVLPASLRQALHKAMAEPRADVATPP